MKEHLLQWRILVTAQIIWKSAETVALSGFQQWNSVLLRLYNVSMWSSVDGHTIWSLAFWGTRKHWDWLTLWRLLLPYGYSYPVPNRVKQPFVIFHIQALWRSALCTLAQGWASECLDVKNCKWQLNPVWRRMLVPIWQQWASEG